MTIIKGFEHGRKGSPVFVEKHRAILTPVVFNENVIDYYNEEGHKVLRVSTRYYCHVKHIL
jgi:hypothetical protein